MFDIISIGSATVDIFLRSTHFPIDKYSIGNKIEIEEMLLSSGGGGTNTASGFARLGLKTACIARFGDDLFGQLVFSELQKENFDLKYLIKKEKDNTDCSVILVNPDGSRTVLVHRGKTKIEDSVFPWDALRETKWLYIASIEGNVDLLMQIVTEARKNGLKVALNPGNRELQEKQKLLRIFPKVSVLILNKEEARELGINGKVETGPEIMVITNGRQGTRLYSPKADFLAESFLVPTTDETGAGDAFSAGFIGGLIKGFSEDQALKLGMANGASVVGKFGAKTGLLYESEILNWMGKKLKIDQTVLPDNLVRG